MAFKYRVDATTEGFFQNWKDKRELAKMSIDPRIVRDSIPKVDQLSPEKVDELLNLDALGKCPNMGYLWKYWHTIHFPLAKALAGPATNSLNAYKSLSEQEIVACGDAAKPVGDKVLKLEAAASSVYEKLVQTNEYKGATEFLKLERKQQTLREAALNKDRIKRLLELYVTVSNTDYDTLFPNGIDAEDHDDGCNWVYCHHLVYYLTGSSGFDDIGQEFPAFEKLYNCLLLPRACFDTFEEDMNHMCKRVIQYLNRQ